MIGRRSLAFLIGGLVGCSGSSSGDETTADDGGHEAVDAGPVSASPVDASPADATSSDAASATGPDAGVTPPSSAADGGATDGATDDATDGAGAPPAACASTQLSSPVGTTTLTRQCVGTVDINGGASAATYAGPVTDLATILATPGPPQPFPLYGHDGYAPTFTIATGSYVAVAIHVTAPGSVTLTANISYGVPGLISLSTVPGALTAGAPGEICSYDSGSANILAASTKASAACSLVVGQTYFLNFAGVGPDGTPICAPKQTSCRSAPIAYTVNEYTTP